MNFTDKEMRQLYTFLASTNINISIYGKNDFGVPTNNKRTSNYVNVHADK